MHSHRCDVLLGSCMCGRPWSGPEAVRGRSVNVRPRTKTCVGVPRAAQLGQVGFGGMGCKVGGQVPVATDPAHSSHPRHPSGLARGFRGHARGIPISGWRSRMPCSVPRRSVGRPRAERTVRSPLPRSDQFLHVRIGEPVRGSDVFELGAEGFARHGFELAAVLLERELQIVQPFGGAVRERVERG